MAESPKSAVETRVPPGSSRFFAYSTKSAITRPRGDARLARVDGACDVAVGREANVVEHDLVEAGLGRRLGDRDAVVPDPTVVGVDPAEACARRPDAAVRALDCQIRPPLRELRILEADDAADHVDAVPVGQRDERLRVVEGARRADGARERHIGRRESDLAALVLDVELDRVEPVALVGRRTPGTCREARQARRSRERRGSRPGSGRGLAAVAGRRRRRRHGRRRMRRRRSGWSLTNRAPMTTAITTRRRTARTAARRRRLVRRVWSRRARKRSFGSNWSVEHGHRITERTAFAQPRRRNCPR